MIAKNSDTLCQRRGNLHSPALNMEKPAHAVLAGKGAGARSRALCARADVCAAFSGGI